MSPPLFKADHRAALTFVVDHGRLRVQCSSWPEPAIVHDGQVFQVSLGELGIEGRILPADAHEAETPSAKSD
jgi:hypothetical protein